LEFRRVLFRSAEPACEPSSSPPRPRSAPSSPDTPVPGCLRTRLGRDDLTTSSPGRGPGEVATLVTAGRRGEAAGREGGCDQQDRDGGEGVAVCGRQGDQGGEPEGGAGRL